MDSSPSSSTAHQRNNSDPPNQQRVAIQSDLSSERLKSGTSANENAQVQSGGSDEGSVHHVRRWWRFKMREFDDDMEREWWFASTAIPLIVAAIAPFANVMSIAALVTYWRENIDDGNGGQLPELEGRSFADPSWAYVLNVVSLVCGFLGNIFLLFNFTGRVRYILALPATIVLFYLATAVLVAITVCLHIYHPPIPPMEVYTQGYWYAVIAAAFYFVCSMMLMINMLGYFLGHYPQTFDLTDSQRTLILQTMLFFIWLAGGGAIFYTVEKNNSDENQQWSFVNGLYFCDVTILTVGFGDLYPRSDLGRGLVFPYSVGGIIMLGLVISSIAKFAGELSEDKVIKKHVERTRHRTISRAISEPDEIKRIESRRDARVTAKGKNIQISKPFNSRRVAQTLGLSAYDRNDHKAMAQRQRRQSSTSIVPPLVRRKTVLWDSANHKSKKLLILRDEKDRFDAMRKIQHQTHRFKRWYALCLSVISFSLLWVVGAIVFWQCEKVAQGMTYFQALYLCYVSLLTIGYGDLAPKSNAGRCFFVVWSLIAVPTMTILVNDLGGTLIDSFQKGTFRLADFTLLPKKGVYREWIESHPALFRFLQRQHEKRQQKKRLKEGMKYPGEPGGESLDPDMALEEAALHPDLETIDRQLTEDITLKHPAESNEVLARRLAVAIRSVAADLKAENDKRYSFEEWAEITRLIRFTSRGEEEAVEEEIAEGVLRWDWLGENSPMMVQQSEPEFVLDRLCESLGRYMGRVERVRKRLGVGVGVDFNREDEGEKGLDEKVGVREGDKAGDVDGVDFCNEEK